MAGRIIMTLAMSLDGFIADEDGGYDWIRGDGRHALDTQNRWDFNAFLQGVDTVVMGKKCYDQQMHLDFREKTVLIATHVLIPNHDNIRFIAGDVCTAVREELAKVEKDVYLFGGGALIDPFIRANMIDEYIIGVVPVILGSGRPLFYNGHPPLTLSLTEIMAEEGIVILRYVRRNTNAPAG
jgi:dihydrofolate reductase